MSHVEDPFIAIVDVGSWNWLGKTCSIVASTKMSFNLFTTVSFWKLFHLWIQTYLLLQMGCHSKIKNRIANSVDPDETACLIMWLVSSESKLFVMVCRFERVRVLIGYIWICFLWYFDHLSLTLVYTKCTGRGAVCSSIKNIAYIYITDKTWQSFQHIKDSRAKDWLWAKLLPKREIGRLWIRPHLGRPSKPY